MADHLTPDAAVHAKDDLTARSDLELIATINGGDSAAFEVLYFRYRDWVVNLAWRFTRDDHAALDVMQDTFIYFAKKFPGFRLTASLKTFLYPAIRNLSITARHKAERCQATTPLDQIESVAFPEPAANPPADLQFVLAGLQEEQREVLFLRFVDELSLAEIAESMEIPLGTVKSRLHNALQTLRQDPRTKEFFGR